MRASDTFEFPPEVEKAITTPHSHEGPNNRPIWILWRHEIDHDGLSDGPRIDSICDSEENARYNYKAMVESFPPMSIHKTETRYYIERIPANHRFASSMADVMDQFVREQMKVRPSFQAKFRYQREGD